MPLIKKSSVEEVRTRVNVYDLVSRYVSLRKMGANYRGLSPFTTEKTPSFFVYPDKNFYHCFSTSQGGDIFKFVQIKENLTFPEAVEFIADMFSITLEYEKSDGKPVISRSFKKELTEIHEIATDYYQNCFFEESEQGKYIRKYWTEERGFTLDDAKKLRIGFAPVNPDPLKRLLHKKQFSIESIKACGLFFAGDSYSKTLMPRFRGRLMIPIFDAQSRAIAFTARKTDLTPTDISYEEGKYVNSPETEIFKKNTVLFNFDKARKSADNKGFFILVEGQIDTMRMYCSGFENTVASQGTGAGAEHFALMKRHCDKVVLLFDGDNAGRKTAMRVIPICLNAEIEPYIANLPDGEDPDSFIRKNGIDAMKEIVENKRENAVSYVAKHILDDIPNPTASDKLKAMRILFELISTAKSQVILDDYLLEISRRLVLDPISVNTDFKKWKKQNAPFSQKQPKNSEFFSNKEELRTQGMLTNAVYDALFVSVHYDNVAEAMSQIINDDWISDDSLESCTLRKLLALHREGIGFDINELRDNFDEEEQKNLIYKLLTSDKSSIDNPIKYANDCIVKIYNNFIRKEIDSLNRKLTNSENDTALQISILKKITLLRKESKTPPSLLS